MNFLESQDADKVPAIATGTIDIANPSYSNQIRQQITEYNGGDDSLDGSEMTIRLYDFLGYGYVGLSAENIMVGGDPCFRAVKKPA